MSNEGNRYIPRDENGAPVRAASHYGPRGFEDDLPSEYVQSQGDKVQIIPAGFDTVITAKDGDEAVLVIPANATITSATVTTTSLGGADTYDIGTADVDGANGADITGLTAIVLDTLGEIATGTAPALSSVDRIVIITRNGTANVAGDYTVEIAYRTTDDRTGINQNQSLFRRASSEAFL